MPREVSIAIIQRTAIYHDLDASVSLAEQLIEEAAAKGARLIVFGECWLCGYPAWIDYARDYARWDSAATKHVFGRIHANSPSVDHPGIQRICAAAGSHGVVVVIGFNESLTPATGTLYNSFIIIDADGKVVQHHRKLMPTHSERLIHGLGDGRGLEAVDTAVGRIGGLICWEHWMPLTRQAMHNTREEIHIALWPTVHEALQIASRHYAFEGRCFVVAAGQNMRFDALPDAFEYPDEVEGSQLALSGGSSLIGPDGMYLTEPQYGGPEIVYTTIPDLDITVGEKMALDVSGHYQRPDIFSFEVLK